MVHPHRIRLLLILTLTCAALLSVPVAQAVTTIVYVNDNAAGANNGSSWANAYTSLQTALANANPVAPATVEI